MADLEPSLGYPGLLYSHLRHLTVQETGHRELINELKHKTERAGPYQPAVESTEDKRGRPWVSF